MSQKQVSDNWGAFGHWIISSGKMGVMAVKELEKHMPDIAARTFRPVQALFTTAARKELCSQILETSCTGGAQLQKLVNQIQRNMLVNLHWRRGNPHLTLEKEGDEVLKANWASNVPIAALRLNLGSWTESPECPLPPWTKILEAKLYTEEQYKGYLDVMAEDVKKPLRIVSEGPVKVFKMSEHYVRFWHRNPQGVPVDVQMLQARIIFVRANFMDQLSPFARYQVAEGALLLCWGAPDEVKETLRPLENFHVELRTVDIHYLVRMGHSVNGMMCKEFLLRVIGMKNTFKETACSTATRFYSKEGRGLISLHLFSLNARQSRSNVII